MSRRFTQAYDGEWIQPRKEDYKITCCDCGLVHSMEFRMRNGNVQFRPTRDNRATGQRRRYLRDTGEMKLKITTNAK
jgi:hypothetical protein